MGEITRHSVINQIIEKYNLVNPNYLEIGVMAGGTFKNVNSTNKDGVDPDLYGNCCELVNYKMLSDDFFANHISKKYDIIFVDGLHTAHQVSVDIYNSIKNLSDGGWIILDDVFPHNELEQDPFYMYKSGPQTGDVWKAVYNIWDDIIEMSNVIHFFPNTERGFLVFKLKPNNTKNITVDDSIPKCNVDGLSQLGDVADWKKYSYKKDFNDYFVKLCKYLTKSL